MDSFPLRDLTDNELGYLRDFLGRPTPEMQFLVPFIEYAGKPLLSSNYDLLRYMSKAKTDLLEITDRLDNDGVRAFTASSMVYAATYTHVTTSTRLPIEAEALARTGDREVVDFLMAAEDCFDEYPRLQGLFDVILPELGVSGHSTTRIALLGAKSLHLAILEAAKPESPEERMLINEFEDDLGSNTTDWDKAFRELSD